VRTYSNKVYCRQFAVSRTTTSCSSRTERHARHSPHCRLPAFQRAWFHWTRKMAAEQSRSKSRGFSVDSVVADGVTSQNFRHWSAEASSDRLLGSAKPGHTEPSDWSAAKKIEDGYQGIGWSCWISSGLTICVNRSSLFYCISNENWTKLVRHCPVQCNFGGIDDVCKLGKEYLTAFTCKYAFHSRQFWNFWRITRVSIISHCKVIWSITVWFFGTPYVCWLCAFPYFHVIYINARRLSLCYVSNGTNLHALNDIYVVSTTYALRQLWNINFKNNRYFLFQK